MTAESKPTPQQPRSSQTRKSFLLRCWQEPNPDQEGKQVWRFSVREVSQSPQEHHFSTPGQLLDHLANALDKETEGNYDIKFESPPASHTDPPAER